MAGGDGAGSKAGGAGAAGPQVEEVEGGAVMSMAPGCVIIIIKDDQRSNTSKS